MSSDDGWWKQLQRDEYRSTQTSYGDPRAAENPSVESSAKRPSHDRKLAIQCIGRGHRREVDSNLENAIRKTLNMTEGSPITSGLLRETVKKFACSQCQRRGDVVILFA